MCNMIKSYFKFHGFDVKFMMGNFLFNCLAKLTSFKTGSLERHGVTEIFQEIQLN